MLNEALYGDHPLVLPPEGDVESLQAIDFTPGPHRVPSGLSRRRIWFFPLSGRTAMMS